MILLPVFDVQRHDVLVHLLQVIHRVAARGREVADIQIDPDILRASLHCRFKARRQVELPGLHIVVAVLQAYVFMLLSIIYVSGAVAEEH